MPLSAGAVLALAQACAPQVAPTTLLAVVRAESGLEPLTIGVNASPHRSLQPRTPDEAAALARALRASRTDFDLGLAQINVRNLPRLGLTVEQALDPCRNLAAGGRILTEAYVRARAGRGTDAALAAALSAYNTGDLERGVRNGYVARVYRAAAKIVPSIADGKSHDRLPDARPDPVTAPAAPSAPSDEPGGALDGVDVFARPPRARLLVWSSRPSRVESAPPPQLPTSTGDPS